MDSSQYTCACCKGEFTKGWSDQECEDEWNRNFPGMQDDRVMVCDVCFKEIMKFNNHEII